MIFVETAWSERFHHAKVLDGDGENNTFCSGIKTTLSLTLEHISVARILVFDVSDVEQVRVAVDGAFLGDARRRGDEDDAGVPLYTLRWQPTRYATGTHTLSVTVVVRSSLTTCASRVLDLGSDENRASSAVCRNELSFFLYRRRPGRDRCCSPSVWTPTPQWRPLPETPSPTSF